MMVAGMTVVFDHFLSDWAEVGIREGEAERILFG